MVLMIKSNPKCIYPDCKNETIDNSSYCILHDAIINEV